MCWSCDMLGWFVNIIWWKSKISKVSLRTFPIPQSTCSVGPPLPSPYPQPQLRHPDQKGDMYTYGCLRMCYCASWQNFANVGSPANVAIAARTAPKCCAGSQSQSKYILDLDPIPCVIFRKWGPWPECHCAFLHTILPQITLNAFSCSKQGAQENASKSRVMASGGLWMWVELWS